MRVVAALATALVLAGVLSTAGSGAACPPSQCGPTAVSVAGGSLLAVGTGEGKAVIFYGPDGASKLVLPGALISADGRRATGRDGDLVKTYDLRTRRVVARAKVDQVWQLAGASADGSQTVLVRRSGAKTSFAVRGASPRTVTFDGKFEFDGLRGSKLYVIELQQNGYLVRVADLGTGKLAPDPLKDADEPALIQGQAWERIASPDGRYVFTLYLTGNGGSMIHQLDLREATAKCIDLPGKGDYESAISYALALSGDGKRIYAANGLRGVVATVDVATRSLVGTFEVPTGARIGGNGPPYASAALARDGKTLAFSLDRAAWIVDVRAGKVVRRGTLPSVGAVAWAPGRKLWVAQRDGTLKRAKT